MTTPMPIPSAAELTAATGKFPKHASAWVTRLSELEAHVAECGRLPRSRGGGQPEARLYHWLKNQRQDPVTAHTRMILDSRFPGWNARRTAAWIPFEERLRQLKIHFDAYSAWPSSRSCDPQVLSLCRWLTVQRIAARAGQMSQARKARLDNQVPGWNETFQETWERTAEEIAVFRERHRRMPSGVSTEHNERRLSRWLDDMRRGRGLSPERKDFLDEVLPEWDVTRFGKAPGAAQRAAETTPRAA